MHAGKRVQLRVIAAAIPPVVLTAAYCFVLAEDDVQAFGVYGLLSLGLVLIVERLLTPGLVGKEKWLGRSFWAMNAGLALMVGLSLLPIGLMQAYASIETWLWYARSAEFLQQPLIESDGCASPVTRSP